jgi:hypothetical protein
VARASAASVAECLIAAILRLSLIIKLYIYPTRPLEARLSKSITQRLAYGAQFPDSTDGKIRLALSLASWDARKQLR